MSTITGRYRTCNCTEALVNGKPFWLEDGIMRTLLEAINPRWKLVPKEPDLCTHWIPFKTTTASSKPEESLLERTKLYHESIDQKPFNEGDIL